MSVDLWADTHPIRTERRKSRSCFSGCFVLGIMLVCALSVVAVTFLLPNRTNVLILGIDRTPDGSAVGRSDTIILTTFKPLPPYVGMLSIPRDLWVMVPGVGENRINTAHFFAEAERANTGPMAAMETVRHNFGVDVKYFVRIRFDGFKYVVDAMGGLEIELDSPMSGYEAGKHKLDGDQALAFVRDRAGTDDFFRMERGQLFLKSLIQQSMKPVYWPRLPGVISEGMASIDTNIPIWIWPRLAIIMLLTGPDNIDNRVITRDFVNPFTTSGGAQVLGPNWDAINPVLMEMFGQ